MTTQEKLIKGKMNLLELGSYLGNVSEACRTLGYSRDTFFRLKKQYEESGIDGPREISRRKPNMRNRASEEGRAGRRRGGLRLSRLRPGPCSNQATDEACRSRRRACAASGNATTSRR